MSQAVHLLSGTGSGEADDHLWVRLRHIEQRVREAVDARRAVDPDPDDPYLGQYLTPEAVQRILDEPAPPSSVTAGRVAPPPGSVLHGLTTAFGLSPLDVDLLLVAVAPDLDSRFERLYGYLNDDLSRRRPTVGLALELCGLPTAGAGRFRLTPSAPLVAGGLVEITEPQRPQLSRVLRVPDRVTAHLLGDLEPDARLLGVLSARRGRTAHLAGPDDDRHRVAAAARTGCGLVHLQDRGGDAGRLAVASLVTMGRRPLVVDVPAFVVESAKAATANVPAAGPAHVLATEARLSGGGIVLGPLEALEPEAPERALLLRELCAAADGVPLITYGRKGWDPLWSAESPVRITVGPSSSEQAARQWRQELSSAAEAVGAAHPPAFDDLVGALAAHRLDSGQMHRAATVATRVAVLAGRPVTAADLRDAVRAQNGAGLERLTRRIEPAVGWDDLVLPAATRRQLAELALRARHRDQVLGKWRMRPGGGRGRGVIALFAGESGTGKTMSAEVIAADLGMELYVVDLSTIVDKYIGETEKNLERIFVEASEANGVLLFDEADAIFGKRSQVKDAHDRHANMGSAYLLQRMESFDGIAVLTTNLRANLDEAFTRRLDVVAEFPMPDVRQRRALWDQCLGTELPRDEELDLDFCAERFELAGGSIRACTVTAAYLAAEAGRPLGMAQVVTAVLQEYRKLGRLVLESEFGPWLDESHRGPNRL
ncbi:ATP-binding protein [Streptomyces sp. NPDC056670]|uniref:ATP-binding protein n=1 Tax=Streptomyces sp. NPDC056670 TaxID=3345904 RepID=UPI0036A06A85